MLSYGFVQFETKLQIKENNNLSTQSIAMHIDIDEKMYVM